LFNVRREFCSMNHPATVESFIAEQAEEVLHQISGAD